MAARAPQLPRYQAPGRPPALGPTPAVSLGRQVAGFSVALAGNVALTLLLLLVRDGTTPLSKGFAFMAVVIAAAALGGLGPGVVASVVGFALFNFFFLPPYGSMAVGRLEYVIVLFVFLGLSLVISALLARQAERAGAAEAREQELEVLQDLGRELVTRAPGTETYEAALSHLVRVFGFEAASLLVAREGVSALREAVAVGAPLGTVHPTWDPQHERSPIRMPLHVGRRSLGLVVLAGDRPAPNEAESRVLRAFCDELALVLERDRLLALAESAEELTKMEWALLEQLAQHPGRLLTHRWLLEQVWGPAYGHDVDVLRVFVSQLRRKIEPDPERPAIILTDLGVGYRWILRPSEPAADERSAGHPERVAR